MLKLVFLLFCISLLVGCHSINSKKGRTFDQIPPHDAAVLEDFFRILIQKEGMGYVIYGDKPMVSVLYLNPIGKAFIIFRLEEYNLKLKKGIECFRKYAALRNSKKYTFLFFGDPNRDEHIELLIINRSQFIKTVEKNRLQFERILGPVTGEKLLDSFCKCSNDWMQDVLKNNHELTGILFGYGLHNSHLFQRFAEISEKLYSRKFTIKQLKRQPSFGYQSIGDEIKQLQTQLKGNQDSRLFDELAMSLPLFKADADACESQQLLQKYQLQRRQILANYREGSYFKKTMQKILESSE